MTTELRVEGLEGRGGGSEEESEVAVVDVGAEEAIDEATGVAERAIPEFSCLLQMSNKKAHVKVCVCAKPTGRSPSFPWLRWRRRRHTFSLLLHSNSVFTNAVASSLPWSVGSRIQCQRVLLSTVQ